MPPWYLEGCSFASIGQFSHPFHLALTSVAYARYGEVPRQTGSGKDCAYPFRSVASATS